MHRSEQVARFGALRDDDDVTDTEYRGDDLCKSDVHTVGLGFVAGLREPPNRTTECQQAGQSCGSVTSSRQRWAIELRTFVAFVSEADPGGFGAVRTSVGTVGEQDAQSAFGRVCTP